MGLRCLQACGSGATTAGLALANHLSGYGAKVVGYGVCEDEQFFYRFIDGLYAGLGADVAARDIVRIVQAKGYTHSVQRCGHPIPRSNLRPPATSPSLCCGWGTATLHSARVLEQLHFTLRHVVSNVSQRCLFQDRTTSLWWSNSVHELGC